MSEIGVTLFTSAATIAGGSIAIVAATFSQDRARLYRERTLASALLAEVHRIRSRLPRVEPFPTIDLLALPPAAQLHAWVEQGIIELASTDRAVFARLIDLAPTISLRNSLLQSYQYTAQQLSEAEKAVADLLDAIRSPGERWRTEFSYTSAQAASERLVERQARVTSLRDELARMEAIALKADAAAAELLADAEVRLTAIVDRPIPRFPWTTQR